MSKEGHPPYRELEEVGTEIPAEPISAQGEEPGASSLNEVLQGFSNSPTGKRLESLGMHLVPDPRTRSGRIVIASIAGAAGVAAVGVFAYKRLHEVKLSNSEEKKE